MNIKFLLILIFLCSMMPVDAGAQNDLRRIVLERKHSKRKRTPPAIESKDSNVYILLGNSCVELYVMIPDESVHVSVEDELGYAVFETEAAFGYIELDIPETGIFLVRVTTSNNGVYEGVINSYLTF